jgi:hypothetical protein
MSTRIHFLAFIVFCAPFSSAQQPQEDIFAKYPAKLTSHGHPAKPNLSDPAARLFRTQLRRGAAQGSVFAGHYAVAMWGCGMGCLSFAVIDSVTGRVIFFPGTISGFIEHGEKLTFKLDSRAVHVIGSINEADPADRWYVWNGRTFHLLSQRTIDPAEHFEP